jgi:hypothetical protein
MFERLPRSSRAALVELEFDGRRMVACDGDTVAATLLATGVATCRSTPVSHTPRGPYCLMGVCFECLVTIDGRANQQACMVAVRQGM